MVPGEGAGGAVTGAAVGEATVVLVAVMGIAVAAGAVLDGAAGALAVLGGPAGVRAVLGGAATDVLLTLFPLEDEFEAPTSPSVTVVEEGAATAVCDALAVCDAMAACEVPFVGDASHIEGKLAAMAPPPPSTTMPPTNSAATDF